MSLPDVETKTTPLGLTIIVEWDLVNDAIHESFQILDRVRFRHGDRFRKLERLIESAWEDRDGTSPPWQELQPAWFVATVPFRLSEIIAEARRLKV